ncbi:uncharacterized protein LOC131630883 isoform X1 [Vicia villosa]|uniref:uncharacterized protein LOC131630883 isoform X1 n=2 Tax=Vicia villosa TaxID=3911 RepID=UPI00273C7FE3|nr:uncharacterized protein LOC131630883 isoform X1 [Vicia villosa]XP_058757602.1 uncharacterized protein LOC131630883 isoform X1 [Vicia villosa]XP_058757603.1 uncharacterized protein LOC131630883 isoform X1 [Vicia villosa]XP_058757604.1 uncharacterized protein LOC131630883 isoform X1 [Vicia villosa]
MINFNISDDVVQTILILAKGHGLFKDSNPFTIMESEIVSHRLRTDHSVLLSAIKVSMVLNSILDDFKAYCAIMRKRMKGVLFNYDTGSAEGFGCTMEAELALKYKYRNVTRNFKLLKSFFYKIYNKQVSSRSIGKRKSTNQSSGRSKISKSTSSVNKQYTPNMIKLKERMEKEVKWLTEEFIHKFLVEEFQDPNKCKLFLSYDKDKFQNGIKLLI